MIYDGCFVTVINVILLEIEGGLDYVLLLFQWTLIMVRRDWMSDKMLAIATIELQAVISISNERGFW